MLCRMPFICVSIRCVLSKKLGEEKENKELQKDGEQAVVLPSQAFEKCSWKQPRCRELLANGNGETTETLFLGLKDSLKFQLMLKERRETGEIITKELLGQFIKLSCYWLVIISSFLLCRWKSLMLGIKIPQYTPSLSVKGFTGFKS